MWHNNKERGLYGKHSLQEITIFRYPKFIFCYLKFISKFRNSYSVTKKLAEFKIFENKAIIASAPPFGKKNLIFKISIHH